MNLDLKINRSYWYVITENKFEIDKISYVLIRGCINFTS